MSSQGQRHSRAWVVVALASILIPATCGALEYEIITELSWNTTGDANPHLSYSFQSSHRLKITECTTIQCAYPVVFNTAIYKNSLPFGVKDTCNRFGVAGLGNVYLCSNSYSKTCPSVEGQYYAVSEAEIGFSVASRTAGPVFANCPPTGGCISSSMATSILPLSAASAYLEDVPQKGSNRLAYTLSRTKLHGDRKFLMDEWTVTGDNWANASRGSSDDFSDVVDAQLGDRLSASFLVIQQPVHERNDRWIPLPEIHLTETTLASDRAGSGEIVAVRAEIFENPRIEELQLLYASMPVDETWLRELLKQRITLQFATPKEHPTVAFLVLQIGEQLEVVSTRSVLPKCCPCEGICIPD